MPASEGSLCDPRAACLAKIGRKRHELELDLDANGLEVLLEQLGDANLDGQVDVTDFNLWNSHKFSDSLAWDDGDFN